MRLLPRVSRRAAAIAAGVLLAAFVGWLLAYEPVTRNLVAQDAVCAYCHLEWVYDATQTDSWSRPHPLKPEDGPPAKCTDCHLPEGFWPATYMYTHLASITDLLGNFRDRAGERAGDWLPQFAATAYRVRDGLYEVDSSTCRSCHVESEIKPERKRGQNAHKEALEKDKTCIECHYNLVHSEVAPRKNAFGKSEPVK